MAVKEKAPSPEHPMLVGHLINWISKEFEIECANCDDYEACTIVNEYIPDVEGYRKDMELRCFGEAKTADDIDNEHAKAQFKEFGGRIMSSGKSKNVACPFCIGVPKGSEAILQKVLKELRLLDKPNVKWQAFAV